MNLAQQMAKLLRGCLELIESPATTDEDWNAMGDEIRSLFDSALTLVATNKKVQED